MLIELDPEDVEDVKDTDGNAADKRRSVPPVNPGHQEMDEFEKEEMKKSRSMVKKKLSKMNDLVDHVPKPMKNPSTKPF